MYLNLCRLIFLLVPTLFLSCSCFLFPDFKINSLSYTETDLTVTFNTTPKLEKIKDSFFFLEDECQQAGRYEQHNNSIKFIPENGITKNHDYKVIITTEAEDTNGISLSSKYSNTFTTKEDTTPLRILSLSHIPSGLEISFSSPVDQNLFRTCFAISPSVEYLTIWNEDSTTVRLKYQKPLSPDTRYFITISKDLYNIFNNHLQNEYCYNFLNNIKQSQNFNVYEVNSSDSELLLTPDSENVNISVKSRLKLTLYDDNAFEGCPVSIVISPPLDYKITQSALNLNDYFLSFQEQPEFNSIHSIKFTYTKNIKPQENQLSKEYILNFNNPRDISPDFLAGLIQIEQNNYLFKSGIQTITLPVDSFPTISSLESKEISVLFFFTTSSYEINLEKFSILENINISSTNNCVEIIPYKYDFITDKKTVNEIVSQTNISIPQNCNLQIIKFNCLVKNHDNKGLIKISINKNISDTENNTLKNDLLFIFNKQ